MSDLECLIQLKAEESAETDYSQPEPKTFEEADAEKPLTTRDLIRFQFDLHAHEQHEQAIEPDAEKAEQRDERIGEHGGEEPADNDYDMNDEPARH